jgi:hypothetical protein
MSVEHHHDESNTATQALAVHKPAEEDVYAADQWQSLA